MISLPNLAYIMNSYVILACLFMLCSFPVSFHTIVGLTVLYDPIVAGCCWIKVLPSLIERAERRNRLKSLATVLLRLGRNGRTFGIHLWHRKGQSQLPLLLQDRVRHLLLMAASVLAVVVVSLDQ